MMGYNWIVHLKGMMRKRVSDEQIKLLTRMLQNR